MVGDRRDDDFDPDEDLFDFEETLLASALDADIDDELEELLATLRSREATSPGRAVPKPRVASPATTLEDTQSSPEDGDDGRHPTEERSAPPGPGSRWSLPRSLLVLLVAMTGVNGLVAYLALRTPADGRHEETVATEPPVAPADAPADAPTTEDPRDVPVDRSRELASPPPPIAPVVSEHRTALARARDEIERGRYADARRTVYSLLAVVDRLDEAQRADFESRARFVLAEALHLEALQRLEEEQP